MKRRVLLRFFKFKRRPIPQSLRRRRLMFSIGLFIGVAGVLGLQSYHAYRASLITHMPGDEQAFVNAATAARLAWVTAPNDLARASMRTARAAALCAAVPNLAATNWAGRIVSITPINFPDYLGQKTAQIIVALGDHLTVSTPGAPLLNNPNMMVAAGSPIYLTATSLAANAKVVFSGQFFSSAADCMAELSFTSNGAMRDPEFKIHLTALSPPPPPRGFWAFFRAAPDVNAVLKIQKFFGALFQKKT